MESVENVADGFGKYEVYTTAQSVYCYPDTNVLRNYYGIRDNAQLKQAEEDLTSLRQLELAENPIRGRFTANHLCRIHRYLFGELYPFAGHYRRESISKGQTIFELPQNIQPRLKTLLAGLKSENHLRDTPPQSFLPRLAYYLAELNFLHPFREGNGRATREFVRRLLLVNGYTVDWSLVEVHALRKAMETSVFDVSALIGVLDICIRK